MMNEGKVMNYRSACRAVRVLGMDIVDGLALTFSCADYPAWVRDMNGWPVKDVAEGAANARLVIDDMLIRLPHTNAETY